MNLIVFIPSLVSMSHFILVVFVLSPVTLHPDCVHSVTCLSLSWLCSFHHLSRFIQVVCIPSLASLYPGSVHSVACLTSSRLCAICRLPHFILVVFNPSLASLHPGSVHSIACLTSQGEAAWKPPQTSQDRRQAPSRSTHRSCAAQHPGFESVSGRGD